MVLIMHLQSNAAFAPDSIDFHGAAPVAQGRSAQRTNRLPIVPPP